MERVYSIFECPEYKKRIEKIDEAEKDRIFCRHGYIHLLDVARIAYILYMEGLEERLAILSTDIYKYTPEEAKEIIYAAALLHDIGRFSDEENSGMNHREAGPAIAKPILEDAGYSYAEIKLICDAIRRHGNEPAETYHLAWLIYKADKYSRDCYDCDAYSFCNWPEELKNKHPFV